MGGEMKRQAVAVLCLLALVLEPTFASIEEAYVIGHEAKCSRNSPEMKLLRTFPEPVQEFVMTTGVKHADTLQSLMGRVVPPKALNALKTLPDRILNNVLPTSSSEGGALVLLEEESGVPRMQDCIIFGVLATMCTIVSVFAVYRFFFHEAYLRFIDNNARQVTFEEFGDFAERVYMR